MNVLKAKRILREAGYTVLKESKLDSLEEFIDANGGEDRVGTFFKQKSRGRFGYVAVLDNGALSAGITVYPINEYSYPNGTTRFSLGGGWGLKKNQLKAVLDLVDKVGLESIKNSLEDEDE